MIPNIYLSDEELFQVIVKHTKTWADPPYHTTDSQWPEFASEQRRAIANDAADNAVKQVVEWLESNMALERCDPDVMPYFTDYYWIPKDEWQALKKLAPKGGG